MLCSRDNEFFFFVILVATVRQLVGSMKLGIFIMECTVIFLVPDGRFSLAGNSISQQSTGGVQTVHCPRTRFSDAHS